MHSTYAYSQCMCEWECVLGCVCLRDWSFQAFSAFSWWQVAPIWCYSAACKPKIHKREEEGRRKCKIKLRNHGDQIQCWHGAFFCVATKFTEVLYLSTSLRYLYLYCYFILSLQYILEANFVLNRPGATSTVNLSPPVVFFKCPFSFAAAMLAPGEAVTTVVVVLVEESCTEVVFWLMYLVQPWKELVSE